VIVVGVVAIVAVVVIVVAVREPGGMMWVGDPP